MNRKSDNPDPSAVPKHTGWKITAGLILGILLGVLFGPYCEIFDIVGQAYVGLLQMTVLPYLGLSLIAKTGRLDVSQARRLGLAVLLVLLLFWGIAICLVVLMSFVLPPHQGATFFSSVEETSAPPVDVLSQFIPTNVFRSLSSEFVPAVVVFCLCFGIAMIMVPGKERLLDFLDLCAEGLSRINHFLVRLAPLGLFALSAAAAGTLRVEEFSRLQAYLLMFTVACLVAAFAVLPLLVSSFTRIRYREFLRVAQEPLLTAIATGKLFVVLPQITDRCEALLRDKQDGSALGESTSSVIVPLAYPFPHIGKILAFLFISFAAWYVGKGLTPVQTTAMAATGAVSSFASPLLTVPFLLDQYQLPQDLLPLFILPGFITTRLADVVGVMHLMALTVITGNVLQGQFRVHWGRLLLSMGCILIGFAAVCAIGRQYLMTTIPSYDLDTRLLSLEIPDPHGDVTVYKQRDGVPRRTPSEGSALLRIKNAGVLRVGYQPDHLPYSFFNQQQRLVGLDVELMHHLAERLDVKLEFIPYTYDSVIAQLDQQEIDVAVGGLLMTPERMVRVGFTDAYQVATISVLVKDHRRRAFTAWDGEGLPHDLRLATRYDDLTIAARRRLPELEVRTVDSVQKFFEAGMEDVDGLLLPAEEAAAWNVLYPEFTVVIPRPVVKRPVGIALRSTDANLLRFLNGWLEFERMDGSIDQLRTYWIEGGGTKVRPPRWCVLRDVLHWLP